jgi:hypothetical protein
MPNNVLYRLTIAQMLVAALAVLGIFDAPSVEVWIRQVIGIIVLAALLLTLAVFGPLKVKSLLRQLFSLFFGTPMTSRLIIMLLVAAAMAGLATIISRNPYRLPPLWAYLPLILVWPYLVIGILTRIVDPDKHRAAPFLRVLTRLAISFLIFFVMLEILLQLFITRLPWAVVGTMPQIRAIQQPQTERGGELRSGNVRYTMNGFTGDLYNWICPTQAEKEPTLFAEYTQDQHGFRNPAAWPDKTDIVVVGDSFVAALPIQHPFWEGISPSLLEFGIPGIGNVQGLNLLRKYGLPRSPKIVVMTYFEGNDITDNWTYHLSQPSGGQPQADPDDGISTSNINYSLWDYLVSYRLLLWLRDQSGLAANCVNPVQDTRGNTLTFSTYYTSVLSIDSESLRQSDVFKVTQDAIVSAATETRAIGGTFILMFIPEKLHAYWNELTTAGQIIKLMRNERVVIPQIVPGRGLVPNLDLRNPESMTQELTKNIDGQRRLLRELADQSGFLMLDLTSDFQKMVDSGGQPYFYGDSHWNQAGHDLAKKALRDFLIAQRLITGE